MINTVIRNGLVVGPDGVREADVAVSDGRIVRIGVALEAAGAEEIDAGGLLVLPGVIDAHAHPVYLDDLSALAISGAHGGVTTLIHYAYAKPGDGLMAMIERFREEAEGVSLLDFALHGGLFDPARQSEEIPRALEAGVTSHKLFMTYAKLGWMTDDYQLMRTLDILGRAGGMGMVHAENGLATDYLEDRANAAGEDPCEAFVATRPAILEAEAIHRAVAMAAVAGCPLYIPHMTAELGVEVVARARAAGRLVYAETCPQYLTLTQDELQRQGPLVKIGPPLRSEADRIALWRALAAGSLDSVASDHAPKAKARTDDFFAAPFGSPQIETMLPLVYDGCVRGHWLSLPRLARVLSENPARIFGLYPQKGTLREGSDADLVLFDPDRERTITRPSLHSNAPYTPYEGRKVRGEPVLTMQRGEILVERGELRATPGRGRFLRTRSGRAMINELAA